MSAKQLWQALDDKSRQAHAKHFVACSQARVAFADKLQEKTADVPVEHPSDLAILTSDRTFQIAEFFALLMIYELEGPEALALFIERHNEGIAIYGDDPQKALLYGVGPQRQTRAIFSDKAKEAACSYFAHMGAFDQSDLARFLYHHMAEETCRKTVQSLANLQLLERIPVGTSILVKSPGTLEAAYLAYLDAMSGMGTK